MEFLVISKTKLKIILDKEDVAKYKLSDFTSDSSRELRRRLREILKEAKERVGFDTGEERVLISYYPTRLAGAELFVSVISGTPPSEVTRKYIYIFATLGELSRACRSVVGRELSSSVYYFSSGEYCLAVDYHGEYFLDTLSEFSGSLKGKTFAKIAERSKCLAKEGAVEIFSAL